MAKTIIIVISKVDFSYGFLWFEKNLDRTKFDPVFVFLNDKEPLLYRLFKENNTKVHYWKLNGKKDYPVLALKFLNLFIKVNPHVVHTHLFDACFIALPVAKLLNIPRRIHTRHHSTWHHEYFPSMIKYDKFINNCSTHIIAISQNVQDILHRLENVPLSKIKLVHHGFEMQCFHGNPDDIKVLEERYLPDRTHYPVIGVISRYTRWKGIQYIIPAFRKLLNDYPTAFLILANAGGEYESEIKKLLLQLPDSNYREIRFEKDVFSLYHLFDIFVHVPVDEFSEAFGQTYVEALAAGIPSVFTLSGVAKEFVINRENALTVSFRNETEILNAVKLLISDPILSKRISEKGRNDVFNRFKLKNMMEGHENLYEI